jgi:hypothetical protein
MTQNFDKRPVENSNKLFTEVVRVAGTLDNLLDGEHIAVAHGSLILMLAHVMNALEGMDNFETQEDVLRITVDGLLHALSDIKHLHHHKGTLQ